MRARLLEQRSVLERVGHSTGEAGATVEELPDASSYCAVRVTLRTL